MALFLGIDLGTSYFKAGIFDENGRLKGLGRRSVEKVGYNLGYCELAVNVFWDTLQQCIEEALLAGHCTPRDILSVSYSSQANSFILLDRQQQPLTPLILWPDNRYHDLNPDGCPVPDMNGFMEETGLGIVPNSQFCMSKIAWFQKEQPSLWGKTDSILSISDYFTFMLTGIKAADYSTAAMTGFFDSSRCQWRGQSFDWFGLKPNQFAEPVRVGTILGKLTGNGAQYLGLAPGTLFCAGGLDHHMAAIGAGIARSKRISESTGTVLACVSYQEQYSPQANCCVAPGLDEKHFFKMAFDENGASSLEWYRNEFFPEMSIIELLLLAEQVMPGCEGLVAVPCAFKYPLLKGFANIQPHFGPGYYIRALLESTAFSLLKLVERIKEPPMPREIGSTGGGARSRLWIRIKADMLNTGFCVPECRETACLGAAMLGAIGSGKTGTRSETMSLWIREDEYIIPLSGNTRFYQGWIKSNENRFV